MQAESNVVHVASIHMFHPSWYLGQKKEITYRRIDIIPNVAQGFVESVSSSFLVIGTIVQSGAAKLQRDR